jgi:hypothetical protein
LLKPQLEVSGRALQFRLATNWSARSRMSQQSSDAPRLDARGLARLAEPHGVSKPLPLDEPASVFLTAAEAAAFLRISPITLGRWRIEGCGPAYRKFGSRVLYKVAYLMNWSDGQLRLSTSHYTDKT